MKRLSDLAVNPNGFAFDPNFGEGFVLNETALQAVRELAAGSSVQDTALKLSETYDIPKNEALSDMFDLVAKLRILGFEV